MPEKTLLVSAIKNGTVIDHITAGRALAIIKLLQLAAAKKTVTLGLNLPSRALGAKDLIKIEGRELSEPEANEVAILAPKASVNIIRNYKIIKKLNVTLPKIIERFVACPNLKCVTNSEKMNSAFFVTREPEVTLRCKYCEKAFSQEEIKL